MLLRCRPGCAPSRDTRATPPPRSDNATNLSSTLLYLYYRRMEQCTGVSITAVTNNEPHCGKDCCDAHFGVRVCARLPCWWSPRSPPQRAVQVLGAWITRYLGTANASVSSPQELFEAIAAGAPPRTTALLAEVDKGVADVVRRTVKLPLTLTAGLSQARHVTLNDDGSMSFFRLRGHVVPMAHFCSHVLDAASEQLPGPNASAPTRARRGHASAKQQATARQKSHHNQVVKHTGLGARAKSTTRDLSAPGHLVTTGQRVRCERCTRDFATARGLRQHAASCGGVNVKQDRGIVAVASRHALEVVAAAGTGGARSMVRAPTDGDDHCPAEDVQGVSRTMDVGWAAKPEKYRKTPPCVSEFLFDTYFKSVKVDPDHPVTPERAFLLLMDATTATGAPLCPKWFMVTAKSTKSIMQHFRNRKVVKEYVEKHRGNGGGGVRGRRGRGAAAAGGGGV